MATISEIPRWPGYETVQFWMNITDMKDNQLLGRYNASAENSTIEIEAVLPDSVINQCATLKISASAVSEQYGEGEATETFTELYKSKLIVIKTSRITMIYCQIGLFFHYFKFTMSEEVSNHTLCVHAHMININPSLLLGHLE